MNNWGNWAATTQGIFIFLQVVVAIVQVRVTRKIARELNEFSKSNVQQESQRRKSETDLQETRIRADTQRNLSESWQTLNIAILTNRDLRASIITNDLDDIHIASKSREEGLLVTETLMYFRLNLLHQLWTACRTGNVDKEYAKPIWESYLIKIYEKDEKLFRACCSEERGYEKGFVKDLLGRLPPSDNWPR